MVASTDLSLSQNPQVIRPQTQIVTREQSAPIQQPQQTDSYEPTNYAPQKTINPIPLIIIGAVATLLGISTYKTAKLGSIFKDATKNGTLDSNNSNFAAGKVFVQNLNPLNWFKNKETAKKLTEAGYTDIKDGKIFKNADDDIVILNGNAAIQKDGKKHESAIDIIKNRKKDSNEVSNTSKTEEVKDKTEEVENKTKTETDTPEKIESQKIEPETDKNVQPKTVKDLISDIFGGKEVRTATPDLEECLKNIPEIDAQDIEKIKEHSNKIKNSKINKFISIFRKDKEPNLNKILSPLSKDKQNLIIQKLDAEAIQINQSRKEQLEALMQTKLEKINVLQDQNCSEAESLKKDMTEIQNAINKITTD